MNSLKKIECKAVNIKLQAKEVWNLPEPFAFRGLFDEIWTYMMPVFLFWFLFSLGSFLHTCVGCVRKCRLLWVWKPLFGLCIVSKLPPILFEGLSPPPGCGRAGNLLDISALWWQTLACLHLHPAVQNPAFFFFFFCKTGAGLIDNGD